MPDDANGNYTLPSGYLAVTGQTIQPNQHNPPLEDIATALTGRLPRSGVAPMTGPLKTVTGSASSPAISPNNNPAIGIYWTATGIAFAGTVSGTRYIGELIPYTFLTPEPLTVLPYGQTLLRASYPDLWAKAQTDIAAGNTFYNNGNGTTTFGIGDMRGRVPAGKDDMGGTPANLLTSAYFADATKLGATGGNDHHTLTIPELPVVSPTFTGTTDTVNVTSTFGNWVRGALDTLSSNGGNFSMDGFVHNNVNSGQVASSGSFTPRGSVNPFGSGNPHSVVQPTLVCNFLLYVGA